MLIKGLIDEDFVNYKKISMTIMFPFCTFKCGTDYCQNSLLSHEENIEIGVYNLCDIKVCTLYDTYFAGMDTRDKRRYVFNYTEINQTIFENRLEALETIKEAEENKPIVSDEIYYEED